MTAPPDPPIAEEAPSSSELTAYDQVHLITYLRLLDAEAVSADWREVATIVLGLDPSVDPGRAERVWRSHLERAQWMTRHGYRALLDDARPG